MTWILIVGAIVLVYLALAMRGRSRNRRLTSQIMIPSAGQPSVSFAPEPANQDDLCLLTLCYATKMRWLLNNEPDQVRDALTGLIAEAVSSWDEAGPDLISRMPTGKQLRSEDAPQAAASGETFRISFYRTDYQRLRNRASVVTHIPRPGMVVNLAWSVILLLNAVEARLDDNHRQFMRDALRDWLNLANTQLAYDTSQQTLRQLNDATLDLWMKAVQQRAA
jgi:hypothetical protein